MAAILAGLLPADCLRWLVGHSKHRFEPCDLQYLPHRWARCGEFQVTAGLAGLAVRGKKHVYPGRVAEIYPRQVNNQADRAVCGQYPCQLTLQPGNGVQVDLAVDRHDDVFPLLPACDL